MPDGYHIYVPNQVTFDGYGFPVEYCGADFGVINKASYTVSSQLHVCKGCNNFYWGNFYDSSVILENLCLACKEKMKNAFIISKHK